jgi:serine/threonine-protein kinase
MQGSHEGRQEMAVADFGHLVSGEMALRLHVPGPDASPQGLKFLPKYPKSLGPSPVWTYAISPSMPAPGRVPTMFEKLGKFEIKRVLGNGAMGEVYLGVDPSIGREVAIKTILPAAAKGGDAKERFAREARAAGALNHPNLVTIYEFGEDQGVLYIAMEFVKGHDLDELLQDRSLSLSESLEVLAQVCDGLDFAHRQQIVHRDIKPTNVRVQRDGKRLHAKVMDFGVAKISNSDMTATGMVMGTVSYMAPEYIRTGKPDPRSDLFAVGVMLYECLSGRKPFAGDTTPTVLYKIVNEAHEPIDTDQLRGISPAIRSVLDRSLTKNPDERFQSAGDFAKALRAAKDPSWMGQVEDTTSLLRASAPTAQAPSLPSSSAPTAEAPSLPSPSAPTFQSPALAAPIPPPPPAPRPARPAPARSGSKGLWLALAALALIGVGATSWWALKGPAVTGPMAADVKQDPAPTDPAKSPQGSSRPAAGNSSSPQASGSSLGSRTVPQGPAATQGPSNPGPKLDYRPEPSRPEPVKPPARPAEIKVIDHPELVQPEKLEKLEVHERKNLGNLSVSESIQASESQPDRAINGFRQAIKADPTNANARAWLAVVLYRQGRLAEFHQELREARRLGLLSQMVSRNLLFKSVLSQARFNQKLPPDLMD